MSAAVAPIDVAEAGVEMELFYAGRPRGLPARVLVIGDPRFGGVRLRLDDKCTVTLEEIRRAVAAVIEAGA